MKSTLAAVLAGLALALPALLQPGAARAADSPFLGKWALDVTNSTMMDPKPKSVQVDVTAHDAKHVVWTETAVTAKGKTRQLKYNVPLNGKLIQGPEKNWKMSGTQADDKTLKFHSISTKGDVEDETCTADGAQTVTCEGTYTAGGKATPVKEIYTKQAS
jgi:hypothetical protein